MKFSMLIMLECNLKLFGQVVLLANTCVKLQLTQDFVE